LSTQETARTAVSARKPATSYGSRRWEIIAANPDKVEGVKAKPAMLGWFVGQVMKASGGKANPQAVNEILRQKLGLQE
jgi:hypothetical protein